MTSHLAGSQRPEALLLDLDGTLLDEVDVISSRVVDAVRAAARKIPVGIASGRVLEDVNHFARLLGLHGPQVSDNGARLSDTVTGRTLVDVPIETHAAKGIVHRLERDNVRYFAVDSGRTVRQTSLFTGWRVTVITSSVSDQLEAEKIAKEEGGDAVNAICSIGSRGEWYVNYTHRNADKGHGARLFGDALGVDISRVMAIGDGFNDVEMFNTVGMPVAMGHAPERVRQLARHTTGTLEEDGVAQAIERFVL
jgi:HAD superfamily hydrolase (TIGR01484 family)